jgi:hypothetical protein
MRTTGHNNLPNFIGRFFPQRDEQETYSFYCASMLLLLKPWRNIETDLKLPTQSWESAFDDFISSNNRKYQGILSGIQYFHNCETSAKEQREEEFRLENENGGQGRDNDEDDFEADEETVGVGEEVLTEEGLEHLIKMNVSPREYIHARLAVEIAKQSHIFPEDSSQWDVGNTKVASASGEDLLRLLRWKQQMKGDVLEQNVTHNEKDIEDTSASVTRSPTSTSIDKATNLVTIDDDDPNSETALPPVEISQLTADQTRAYSIMNWHLDQTLLGKPQRPLRMIMYGEGGTGKSRVIQTVTEAFLRKGVPYLLVKAAYTGIAASLVKGKTTHFVGQISFNSAAIMSDETKAKLREIWRNASYMIIDEYSMLSKTFLAQLSQNIGIGVAQSGRTSDESFGGINVILCGDLHQFPPVALSIKEALFHPTDPLDPVDSVLGSQIYREFSTVVILKEQHRTTDPVWMDFLHHLRIGDVQDHHMRMLQKQVIGHPDAPKVDFSQPPWNDASFVTLRHAVREEWNSAAIRKWCSESKERLYICQAKDTYRGRTLSMVERYAVAARLQGQKRPKRQKRKDLPAKIEIAIGMKVMVTSNVETDLDITNGARGTIVDIVLHPDEPEVVDGTIVKLKHLPSYILVKLSRTRASKLEGLDESIIPIEPTSVKFQIRVKNADKKLISRTVSRKQFPMTAAYAFTDYRSQGQTIPYVIVDIARPPTGGLNLFNLYVALSCSSGRTSILLLRNFEPEMFQKNHISALMLEDDRLEHLNELTKIWWDKEVVGNKSA